MQLQYMLEFYTNNILMVGPLLLQNYFILVKKNMFRHLLF